MRRSFCFYGKLAEGHRALTFLCIGYAIDRRKSRDRCYCGSRTDWGRWLKRGEAIDTSKSEAFGRWVSGRKLISLPSPLIGEVTIWLGN